MPTAKPRVAVTLSRGAYEVLSRLARARGVSRSSVLAELFEAAVPAMERVAEAIETAKAAPQHVLQRFVGALELGERELDRTHTAALGQLDLLVHGLRNGKPWGSDASAAEAAAVGGPRRRQAPETPVSVTRGSGVKGAPPRTTRKAVPRAVARSSKPGQKQGVRGSRRP